MPEIRETTLPGIGVCCDFPTRAGPRIGVVTRQSGRRELVVYERDDPDTVESSIDLAPEEANLLAELLSDEVVVASTAAIEGLIEGLAFDWVPLSPSFTPAGIGSLEIRTRTGATVVAIVRSGSAIPAPGPDEELRPGDTAVLVGTPGGLSAATSLLDA